MKFDHRLIKTAILAQAKLNTPQLLIKLGTLRAIVCYKLTEIPVLCLRPPQEINCRI